jgi:hypothetical protein
MWRPDLLTDIAAAALKSHAEALAAEQAVRGLDALAETGFHPILAAGYAAAGFGVFREQPYPGQPMKRPRHMERERCDLALTDRQGVVLRDPVAAVKALDAASGTLFEGAAPAMVEAEGGVDPADAFWLEVKAVGQYCYTHGVPGPNRAYSSELLSLAGSDIPKLSKEPMARFSGILVVLFTADEVTAKHDLGVFMHRCLDKDLPVQSPSTAGFRIVDIIGNAWCTVTLVPVRPDEDCGEPRNTLHS